MKLELNDETLTAYALGELDSAETKAIEKLLGDAARAGNDAPRKTLEEIRAAVEVSTAAFAGAVDDAGLTEDQRDVIDRQSARTRAPFRTRGWALAVAAALLICATFAIAGRYYLAQPPAILVAGKIEGSREVPPAVSSEPGKTIPQEVKDRLEALGYGEPETAVVTPAQPVDAPVLQPESKDQESNTPSPPVQAEPTPAVTRPSVDPLRYQSDRPSAEASQAQQVANPKSESNTAQVQDKANAPTEEPAGPKVDSGLQRAPEVQPSPKPTFEFRRRPRSESEASNEKSKVRDEAPKEAGAVAMAPKLAAAAAAPAVPRSAPLPEISGDLLFGPAPASSQNREQLESVGYSDSSSLQQFKTAAIDDRIDSRRIRVEQPGTEAYKPIIDNQFIRVNDQPLSTFSIDVDTASYSNVRRFLEQGQLPPRDAVRVEELINYFDYVYPAPTDGAPFAAHLEAASCPWNQGHSIVRIGLKGREVPRAERPATNLVFLIDVSGSMADENKLPLVKRAMAMLTRQLDERDRVSIVTYASGVNLALAATNASHQERILGAIENLGAGGSTNGAGGIQLAYQMARENFLDGGVNRVILATDGDFNVGISDNDSLLSLIQREAKSGVFLSVFGFGMGNLQDDKLELLADKGNGVYGYIDSESEARKAFVEKLSGTLVTIAKDVKIQVEFNPARVAAYRLIGYENRALAAQDFNDDRKDAGEIGAGHTVTALYEVVPAGQTIPSGPGVDALRYQTPQAAAQNEAAKAIAPAGEPAHGDEMLLVKLRYKEPSGDTSKLLEFPLKNQLAESPSADLKFASAVAAFGKFLRGDTLGLSYDGMMQLAQAGLAASDDPRRAEMIHLMLQARPLIEGRNDYPAAYGVTLEQIRGVGDGTYRAKIRTRSRSGWYANGQAFEEFVVLNIDAAAGCVYMQNIGTTTSFQLCLDAQSAQ